MSVTWNMKSVHEGHEAHEDNTRSFVFVSFVRFVEDKKVYS